MTAVDGAGRAFQNMCKALAVDIQARADVDWSDPGDELQWLRLSPWREGTVGLTVVDRGDQIGLFLLDTIGGWIFRRDPEGVARADAAARAVIAGKLVETVVGYGHTRVVIESELAPLQFDAVLPPERAGRWSVDRLRFAVRPHRPSVYLPY